MACLKLNTETFRVRRALRLKRSMSLDKTIKKAYSYFCARYYDPRTSLWLSVDPMAMKYPSYSPYNYCLNNPIIYIDPDGREIEGVDKHSAKQVLKSIKQTFRGAEYRKLRKLLRLEGNKMAKIDEGEYNKAISNINNKDAKLLANGYKDAINSTDNHTVEVVKRGGRLKSDLSKVGGYLTGKDVDNSTGGGFNYGKNGGGSHSVLVSNSKVNIEDYQNYSQTSTLPELLAHELIGHGLTRVYGGGSNEQWFNAIALTNMYNRVINNNNYRDGSAHGGNPGRVISQSESNQYPIYLDPRAIETIKTQFFILRYRSLVQ